MVKKLRLYSERCKECSICIKFCPDSALEYSEDFTPLGFRYVKWSGKCRLCGICYTVCPDCVFEIIDEEALER